MLHDVLEEEYVFATGHRTQLDEVKQIDGIA